MKYATIALWIAALISWFVFGFRVGTIVLPLIFTAGCVVSSVVREQYRSPIALFLFGIFVGMIGIPYLFGRPPALAYALLAVSLVSIVAAVVMAAMVFFRNVR